jgi:DNA phosphorothioation-dependent restriction protein DptG
MKSGTLKPSPEITISISKENITQQDSSGWADIAEWYNHRQAWDYGIVSDKGLYSAFLTLHSAFTKTQDKE